MGIRDIVKKANRFALAATRERLTSPEVIQKTKAVRHPVWPRKAFCKTDAGQGSTLVCHLDVNETGEEIIVFFSIIGTTHLNEATPLLKSNTMITVYYDRDTNKWRCVSVFEYHVVCPVCKGPP